MSDKPNNNVLVLGGGMIGASVAGSISSAGYRVVLSTEKNDLRDHENIDLLAQSQTSGFELLNQSMEKVADSDVEIMTNTDLFQVDGYVGDFKVALQQSGKLIEKEFGAIVATSDIRTTDLKKAYKLNGNQNVLSLSELEGKLDSGLEELKGKKLAFMFGLKGESNHLEFGRLIASVNKLQDAGCYVYVFVDNLKLTSFNLDQQYHDARSKGALFFKSPGEPQVAISGEQLKVTYLDSALMRHVELDTDFVVVDQAYLPGKNNSMYSKKLGIALSSNKFLQSENVHNLSVRTNRKGVFVVGAGKQLQNAADSLSDVHNVVHELDKLFKLPAGEDEPFAEVDPEKCVICLTCLRSCQHKAIIWVDGVAVVQEKACFACGMCASECPMNAIQVKSYSDESLTARIREAAAKPGSLVAFCCKNSAMDALEAARKQDFSIAENMEIIELPCAGKLDMELILEALTSGADGVLALGCHPGNCKSEKGSVFAKRRVAEIHRMLEAIGIEKERLHIATLAGNMGSAFYKIVSQMEETLKKLGPSSLGK